MTKFHAIPTTVDGIRFASKAEARRYSELRLLELAGEISELRPHPSYTLAPKVKVGGETIRSIRYTADFAYVERGVTVVEDVKSRPTSVTAAYRLRRNLWHRAHAADIDAGRLVFREVYR